MPRDAEVIVAGGGPAGLMLANELGRRGVKTLLFSDRPSTSPYPQANATQARTMEFYRRLGFADTLRARGLPADYPTDVAYFTRPARHELARFRLPASRDARQLVKTLSGSWSAAELPHRCSQMYVEEVLRDEAQRLDTVTLVFNRRVTAFIDMGDQVAVETEDTRTGVPYRTTAAFLVGCDGPRSMVRKQLGISYDGESEVARPYLSGRQLSVFLRAPALYDLVPHPRAWQYWSVNPERRGMIFAIDGRDRFTFGTQLPEGCDESDLSDADIRALFEKVFGAACPIEIVNRNAWHAGYSLVAEKYQRGRVFMAGDAVHLFTPTGGLGYNTAIEDVVNLAWKLAATLRGWGGAGLLATYESERQKVGRRNTGFARYFADSIGGFVPPEEIEDDTEAGEAARRVAGIYLNRHGRAEFNIPGITFGARYDFSPIIADDGTSPPPDRMNDYVPSATPGGRAPHAWLADGRSLYDAFGFEFSLLRLGRNAPDAAPFATAAAARGIPLTVVTRPEEELRDLYGADLALIRPDQIVAWRGSRAPGDTDRLLAQLTGHT